MRPGVIPVAALALAACVEPQVPLSVERMPATGYAPVTVDLSRHPLDPGDITQLRVGPLPAYDLRADGDTLTFMVQGGPPGEAEVIAEGPDGPTSLGVLTYEEPVHPLFSRMVAFGASLTQGTRDAVPTASAQLSGPAMQLARAAGAPFPLPLLADPLTPMTVDDIRDCESPDTVGFILGGIGDATARLTDPSTQQLDLTRARVTPEVQPFNVAIGNTRIAAQRLGTGIDPVAALLGRLTLEASGSDLFAPLLQTPIERVLALQPTLIISFDLFGNDLIRPVLEQGRVSAIDPPEQMRDELSHQLDLLEAANAPIVLATLPDVTLLSEFDDLDPDEADALRDLVASYNEVLRAQADARPLLYLAEVAEEVETFRDGIEIGGQTLSPRPFQGLVSLDGLHFTDTAYALVAQVVLDTLEDQLDVRVPPIDVEAVLAVDPRSPQALRDQGLDPACQR